MQTFSLRADVSYFLRFPREAKEIGDVCTQASCKPCSIFSTPAGRGRGPLRPISPMELQAEQLNSTFLLLISLTEEKAKQVLILC